MLGRCIVREKGILSCAARRYASGESTLRAQPWSFQENAAPLQRTQIRTTASRFNLDMASKADVRAPHACFALAAEMKQQGIKPTTSTYNTLLRALGQRPGNGYAMLAVLEDMFRFVADDNLELALQYYHAMKAHNLLPDVAAAQAVIVLAAKQGFPRLAVDLAVSFENETVRKVEDSVWVACLHSSATELYAEGVSKSWYTLVTDLAISPDEGLCMLVLHTAGRNGLPDLATDVLRVLKILDVPWMEHHLAPLFEAFCRAERYQDAFSTLPIMRLNDIDPTTQTALPILEAVKKRPEILDELWEILSQMNKDGKTVDPVACSVLLQASFATQPLSRALADYNTLKSLGVPPSAETFHIFIDGCISAGNVAYGELAFRQLKEAGVPLDHDVFGKMITLHLTQATYDDAFLYLEEMQTAGHVPALHLYEALAIKCATAVDSRYLVVLDEMKQVGHMIPPELRFYCAELYDTSTTRLRAEALKNPEFGTLGMDGSAQKFIETGGLSGLEIPHVGEK
ncbi:Methyltransf-25 domain-containing protein [Mycena venus]|uniref:Methyltransf-25 domain-containing protein n=1 Tax=Mycena venus TaxID=2733690 RepID=A0A8H6YL91_9AGAR|nr:Methyltransf-25 domain-containing protein [Mycena venus]